MQPASEGAGGSLGRPFPSGAWFLPAGADTPWRGAGAGGGGGGGVWPGIPLQAFIGERNPGLARVAGWWFAFWVKCA